jgi:asparagine synthase (glutamine-hydrolysing)
MCGISGIINFNNNPVQEKEIRLMMLKMKHRGPDDEGVFIDNNIGLGFVRLSILDLSPAGHQPMFSHNGDLVIIFNGEIYNYIEIRAELKHKYQFCTGTDTEVILAAYQEWGEDCLNRFNGMFSIVIYDIKLKEVFIARDRYGIKPLYYYHNDEVFIFASEIKSILPLIGKKIVNNKIVYDYLLYNRTDHTDSTFFKNISKLPHGSLLKIKNGKFKIHNWYTLSAKINNNEILSKENYRELFKDSLKLRLRADVPVGVSLSGGIDSSSIVASLIHDFNLNELNTFSAVYNKNEPADESRYIDEFRPFVKNMHFIYPNANTLYKDLEVFIEAHNEPVPDIGPYAQFKVMELASSYVSVTLDGQGADEQLAGYHYFFGSYYYELIKQFKLWRFVGENIKYLLNHKSPNALKYLTYYILPAHIQNYINNKTYQSISKAFLNSNNSKNELNKMLYKPENLNHSLLQHFEYKLEHLLRWEDLNAMHFSIESRVPFLDYRLVEATLSTPSYQKISNGETKYILREALKDILPQKIVQRKDKKGFSTPRDKWFRSEQFKGFIFELINSESFKHRGYFDHTVCNFRYNKHLEGKLDISKEIWKWINLEIWFRKFID